MSAEDKETADFYKAVDTIVGIGRWLDVIGSAHLTLGNETLAKDFNEAARDLSQCARTINSFYGHTINQRVKQSEEATTNMVRAALSSLTMREDR